MSVDVLGYEQFTQVFGNITLASVAVFVLAVIFCYGIYKQIKKFLDNKKHLLIEKYENEKVKDEQLQRVLEEVNKYPQYREQSKAIQRELKDEISGLKTSQETLEKTQEEIRASLNDMQSKQERRERNKLRDSLLKSYRYYTDKQRNPDQTWTQMEAEAFWELFGDYEDMGGDGYMHTVVQPAMNLLRVVDNF